MALERASTSPRLTSRTRADAPGLRLVNLCFLIFWQLLITPANKQMKKARRDGSRRAPTLVLAGPGLRAPRCQAINASLAGDPSEVTALGKRHWITSFRWVDGNINIGGESASVKGADRSMGRPAGCSDGPAGRVEAACTAC